MDIDQSHGAKMVLKNYFKWLDTDKNSVTEASVIVEHKIFTRSHWDSTKIVHSREVWVWLDSMNALYTFLTQC